MGTGPRGALGGSSRGWCRGGRAVHCRRDARGHRSAGSGAPVARRGGRAGTGTAGPGPSVFSRSARECPVCVAQAPAGFRVHTRASSDRRKQRQNAPSIQLYGASDAQRMLRSATRSGPTRHSWRPFAALVRASRTRTSGAARLYMNSRPAAWAAARCVIVLRAVPGWFLGGSRPIWPMPRSTTSTSMPRAHVPRGNWVDQTPPAPCGRRRQIRRPIISDLAALPTPGEARTAPGRTVIDLNKVICDSFRIIVDGSQSLGKDYQAWRCSYLTNNPDGYACLAPLRCVNVPHAQAQQRTSTFARAAARSVAAHGAEMWDAYWARMAVRRHWAQASDAAFMTPAAGLTYATSLDRRSAYKVKANARPRYFGANIPAPRWVMTRGHGSARSRTLAVRAEQRRKCATWI